VYYRRKFKGKAKELEKATISVELSSQHDKNILPASPEEYVLAHSTDIASMDKGKDNVARKKKCCTPISTQMLRRSPRFIEKLNGCKPTMISSKKTTNKNKTKGKKIKSQTDLLDDILLPFTYQTNEFLGLSVIDKYNSVGATFLEIPIAKIQRVATEICCIAPLEVTADLLLTSRPEDEAGPSRSAEI